MNFEFATAGRILFGRGRLSRVGTLAAELGHRPLLVTGRDPRRAEPLLTALRAAALDGPVFRVGGEPTLEVVRAGRQLGLAERCDLVISFGGGSVLDAGKAVAALIPNPGDVLDYLEVIGGGQPLPKPSLPHIAIPTTAGTGTEVTRNAVLASPGHGVKASLRSPTMLPTVALVDPELTDPLPPALSATTGLDALTQLIEAFLCTRANPFTDSLCREGIRRAAQALPVVTGGGPTPAARDDMALAALFSGLALANAGLGAVHGFAGPIGGRFPAPHGAVCAALLAPVLEINDRALRTRAPQHPAIPRFDEVARLVCGSANATCADGLRWIRNLVQQLNIPPLGSYGIRPEHVAPLVEQARKASSMKANPLELTPEELTATLQRAL